MSWYADLFYAYHDHYIMTSPSSVASHPHAPPNNTSTGPPLFYFVGKDQTLINALFFLHPHRFITVVSPANQALLPSPCSATWTCAWQTLKGVKATATSKLWEKLRGKSGGLCGDEWFYYQFWVAAKQERRDMKRVWNERLWGIEELLRGPGEKEEDGQEKGCPLTGVVTIEGVLRRLFGVDWEVPGSSVHVNVDGDTPHPTATALGS